MNRSHWTGIRFFNFFSISWNVLLKTMALGEADEVWRKGDVEVLCHPGTETLPFFGPGRFVSAVQALALPLPRHLLCDRPMKVNAGMLGKATNAVAVRTVDPDGTAVMADENLVDQFAAFWLDDDLLLHDRVPQRNGAVQPWMIGGCRSCRS